MDKEVVLQYVKLRNDYDNGIKTTITEVEQQLINQINSYALGNEEFKNHKAVCNGNGLVKTYGYDKQFTEYVLEIDLNEYVYDTGDISNYDSRKSGNYNLDEAMLYRRETNKMEIIYVEKE